HLVDQQRVRGELERLRLVRPKPKRLPDAAYGRMAEPHTLSQLPSAPVRGPFRRRLQRLTDNFFDLLVHHLARGAGARFVQKPVDAVTDESSPPLPNRRLSNPQRRGDDLIRLARRALENDCCPDGQAGSRLATTNQSFEE